MKKLTKLIQKCVKMEEFNEKKTTSYKGKHRKPVFPIRKIGKKHFLIKFEMFSYSIFGKNAKIIKKIHRNCKKIDGKRLVLFKT